MELKTVYETKGDLEITLLGEEGYLKVSARRILDLRRDDPETEKLRKIARDMGVFIEEECIVNEDEGTVIARRFDYGLDILQHGSYFAFYLGHDKTGWPMVEPTMDDVEEELKDAVYRLRWESVNNKDMVSVSYNGVKMDVETVYLIMPDRFASGLIDNHDLRRCAIEQGVFRPFPH